MKKRLLFLMMVIFLYACHYTEGSGNIVTEKRNMGNFDGISVGGGFDVEVKIGPVAEVTVEADDNIIQYIETTVDDGTLKIRTEEDHNISDAHIKIYITMPVLTHIKAFASADITVRDVIKSSEKLSFSASSSASIVAEAIAPEIEADASSNASIRLTGKTKNYFVEVSSGADVKTENLLSENTQVKASSGASAKVHASIALKASASSGANIRYLGEANAYKTVNSGAQVEKMD